MALELHIAGPGIDVTRRMEAGEPPIILGRDPDCAVCLPDPEKNVSRKHLSVWNEEDVLHFLVVSIVNGVELPSGDVAPGARGVLPPGQTLKIVDYKVTVLEAGDEDPTMPPAPSAVAVAAPDAPSAPPVAGAPDDPWAALDGPAEFAPTQPAPFESAPAAVDADPFGEWGFETTFGADAPGGGLQANALSVAPDISSFFEGLGMDAAKVGVLSQGELEAIGRVVRLAVLGLIDLHKSVVGAKQTLRSEDRTMLASKEEKNPLKEGELSEETVLRYLFGGRAAAAAGYLGPERALRELVTELVVHERATSAAARAMAEGMLKEFDPDGLKARLLGGGSRLFESARAWDAFVKDYGEQNEDAAKWVQRLMNKYFTSAYVRESMRAKRDPSGSGGSAR